MSGELIESPFGADDFLEGWIQEAERENESKSNAAEKQRDEHPIRMIDGLRVSKTGRDYLVEVPLPNAKVLVNFAEILRSRQSFEAVVKVQLVHNTEGEMPAFEQRLDLNSASAVSNLVTSLNNAYGNRTKGYNWTLVLNRAGIAMKKNLLEEKKPLILASDSPFIKDMYLTEHFLEEGNPSMIHGDGSTGKSYFCLYLSACAASGVEFFGKKTEKFKTLYIDMEATSKKLNNRLHRIANGMEVPFASLVESIHWYKPEGSVSNEQEIIARMVVEGGYKMILVDAGASATGGSPMDEQAVLRLFSALEHIPCAKLIIHHEPKDVEGKADDKAYYGTTYWRTAPRLVWRLKRETKEGKLKSIIRASHHKANDDLESEPITYSMEFSEPLATVPTVHFTKIDDFAKSDSAKIIEFLLTGEADLKSISKAITKKETATDEKLNEMMAKGEIDRKRDGKKYVYYVQK